MNPMPSNRPAEVDGGQAKKPTAPLLAPFVVPTFIIVGLVTWIALSSESWLAVAVAMIVLVLLMFAAMKVIGNLLADDEN